MPLLALTVSLLFSAFLIVRDYRRRPSLSAAIWIPTMLVMVLGSRPVSLWMSGGAGRSPFEMANDAATSPLDQIFFLSVLGSSFLVAALRGFKWSKLSAANPAIMLFYLYFALSVMWSTDPSGSTKRIIKDFGLLFVGGVIFTEKNPLQAIRAVYVRCAFVLLPLSVVFIKYFPNYGRSYGIAGEQMMTGVTTQKNSLGEIVLIFSLFLIWDYLEMRPAGAKFRLSRIPWDLIILLLNGIYLLQLSQSKTALVCTLVGAFLLVRSGRLLSKTLNRTVLAGALCLPFLVLFSQQFSSVVAPLIEAMGRNMTFTGRADIWANITLSTVNPLIGDGYWNFWGGPGGYKINVAMNSIIPNAHNGYLDLYLDGGFLGLTLLFVMLLVCGRRITKRIKVGGDVNRYQRMRFAVLIAAIIYNLSESTFARMGPIWFTTLMMIVEFPLPKVSLQKSKPSIASNKRNSEAAKVPALVAH
jgi:O-antigen ligase